MLPGGGEAFCLRREVEAAFVVDGRGDGDGEDFDVVGGGAKSFGEVQVVVQIWQESVGWALDDEENCRWAAFSGEAGEFFYVFGGPLGVGIGEEGEVFFDEGDGFDL